MPPKQTPFAHQPIHPLYTLFFLYIEPLTALAGFIAAAASPTTYLRLTHAPSAPPASAPPPLATAVTLQQLANLYLLFAINEAVVLRAASSVAARPRGKGTRATLSFLSVAADVRVWRALLFGLLIADFGHLWSVRGLGSGIYWRAWEWNSMAFGNVGIVYMGAAARSAFLLGLGVG